MHVERTDTASVGVAIRTSLPNRQQQSLDINEASGRAGGQPSRAGRLHMAAKAAGRSNCPRGGSPGPINQGRHDWNRAGRMNLARHNRLSDITSAQPSDAKTGFRWDDFGGLPIVDHRAAGRRSPRPDVIR